MPPTADPSPPLDEAVFDEVTASRLRIFFSADIVGSTAVKQAAAGGGHGHAPWLGSISAFYRGLSLRLAEVWRKNVDACAGGDLERFPPPRLWKCIGDEVIFVGDAVTAKHAVLLILSYVESLQRYRRSGEGKASLGDPRPPDVKGAIWTAGFPLNNIEICLPRHDDMDEATADPVLDNLATLYRLRAGGGDGAGDIVADYIGPDMDTGFRLAKLATPRRLVVPPGVVSILDAALRRAETARGDEEETLRRMDATIHALAFRYEGRHALKGVLRARPFPVIWIDVSPTPLEAIEDDIMNPGRAAPRFETLAKLSKEFIRENADLLHPPYITSADDEVGAMPDWHASGLERLRAGLRARLLQGAAAPARLAEGAQAAKQRAFLDRFGPPSPGG